MQAAQSILTAFRPPTALLLQVLTQAAWANKTICSWTWNHCRMATTSPGVQCPVFFPPTCQALPVNAFACQCQSIKSERANSFLNCTDTCEILRESLRKNGFTKWMQQISSNWTQELENHELCDKESKIIALRLWLSYEKQISDQFNTTRKITQIQYKNFKNKLEIKRTRWKFGRWRKHWL